MRKLLYLAIGLLLAVSFPAFAANHYIRAGASGSASGADWTNACTDFTGSCATITRGDTYFVATGNYASHTIVPGSTSGTVSIVQGATIAAHGTATGWVNTMSVCKSEGGTQAVWSSAPNAWNVGNFTIDGSCGSLTTDTTQYGFKFTKSCGSGTQFQIGNESTAISGITLAHIATQGCNASPDASDYPLFFGSGNSNVSGLYAHDLYVTQGNACLVINNVHDSTFERIYGDGDWTTSANHGECLNVPSQFGTARDSNNIIRYSIFANSLGTGTIVALGGQSTNACNMNNWQIYGNVFINAGSDNGIIAAGGDAQSICNSKIVNNTFVSSSSGGVLFHECNSGAASCSTATGNLWQNNLVWNGTGTFDNFGGSVTTDHNSCFSCTSALPTQASGAQAVSGNPFTNSSAGNYTLLNAPGTNCSSTTTVCAGANESTILTVDRNGNTFGSNGNWERGAFAITGGGPTAPTVTTTTATSITSTSASTGGVVTSNGGASVTSEGVCYALTANPTTPCTSDGTATPFTSSITGRTPGTLYHYRAFATNSAGTSYGRDLTFTTLSVPTVTTTTATSIGLTTASSGGVVTSNGGASITSEGVCYSTTTNPTSPCTSDGTATPFTSYIRGLTQETLYHYRAFATNSVGIGYGSDLTFTTTSSVTAPTLTTTAASGITSNGATSGGTVVSNGGASVTSEGVCYATTANPTTPCTSDGTATPFTSTISGLSQNTLYHYRAFAANSVGIGYGSELTFTSATSLPCSGTCLFGKFSLSGSTTFGSANNIAFPSWLATPKSFSITDAYSQTVTQTFYLGAGATSCPTNSGSVCNYYPSKGGQSDPNPYTAAAKDWNGTSRTDVIITHGFDYDTTSNPVILASKATKPSVYLRFRSDTPLPYRTACSHGFDDSATTKRNHGCDGQHLGWPAYNADIPVVSAGNSGYTSDSNYNDKASMYSIHSTAESVQGSVIQMGPAHCSTGTYVSGNPPTCTSGGVFDHGVSHIIFEDAEFYWPAGITGTAGSIVQIGAQEWVFTSSGLDPTTYAGAAPDHIGLVKTYIHGPADDDGYQVLTRCRALQLWGSYVWASYSYADGCNSNGNEDQLVSMTNATGPVVVADDWFEGDTETVWQGGAPPMVQNSFTDSVWIVNTRVTANMRGSCGTPPHPVLDGRPLGIKPVIMPIPIGAATCSGGNTLTMVFDNLTVDSTDSFSSTIGPTSSIWIRSLNVGGSAVASGWYTGSNTGELNPTTQTINLPTNGCVNGTNAAAGTILGYNFVNGHVAGDPTNQAHTDKNRVESKEGTNVRIENSIIENSCAGGQTGSLELANVRAQSGRAFAGGGQNTLLDGLGIRNTIYRHGRRGIEIAAKSGNVGWGVYPITNISCSSDGLTATITATGSGGIFNSSTDGWITGLPDTTVMLATSGDYNSSGNSGDTIAWTKDGSGAGVICHVSTSKDYTGLGATITGAHSSNGSGAAWGMKHVAFENILMYDTGDRRIYAGDGSSGDWMQAGPDQLNYGVTATAHCSVSCGTDPNAYIEATAYDINICRATGPSTRNTGVNLDAVCPILLQMSVGDLVNLMGCGNTNFNTQTDISLQGVVAAYVSSDQKTVRFPVPNIALLTDGSTTTCPSTNPGPSQPVSGLFINQGYPRYFEINHATVVGIGSKWTASPVNAYEKNFTYKNSIQVQPSASEATPAGEPGWGQSPNYAAGIVCGSAGGYHSDRLSGITNCFDSTTLKLQGVVLGGLTPVIPGGTANNSYPSFDGAGNVIPHSGVNTDLFYPATVGCANGADATCIGFKGALNTNSTMPLYPLNLTDWTQYALDSTSVFAGTASDGVDKGAIIPFILTGQQATTYGPNNYPLHP